MFLSPALLVHAEKVRHQARFRSFKKMLSSPSPKSSRPEDRTVGRIPTLFSARRFTENAFSKIFPPGSSNGHPTREVRKTSTPIQQIIVRRPPACMLHKNNDAPLLSSLLYLARQPTRISTKSKDGPQKLSLIPTTASSSSESYNIYSHVHIIYYL